MISFQTRLLQEIESIANKAGLDVLQVEQWANTGEILAQRPPFTTVAKLSYHFQSGHNKVLFNDAELGPGEDSALFREDDDAKIAKLLNRWAALCGQS